MKGQISSFQKTLKMKNFSVLQQFLKHFKGDIYFIYIF